MTAAEAYLQRPYWFVSNTLVLPVLSDDDGDGSPTLRSLVSLSLPVIIFLDVILGEPLPKGRRARTVGEDQANIFRSLEGALAGVGVDGRACLLRLICHLQSNPVGQYTVLGELITLLFTPKREASEFLREYQEAEMAGKDGASCQHLYPRCPLSLPLPQAESSSHSGSTWVTPVPLQLPQDDQLLTLPRIVLD